MRRIKSFFLVILLVFTVLSLSSCKKEQYVDVKSMNTITFMVDGTQFGKSYIITGEQGKAIAGPVLEGRKFLYWGIDGIQFDFSNPITENIILNAYFEEAATIVITDHIDLNNLENAKFIISNDVIKGSVVKGSLIKPGVDGSCYFYLSNQTVNDLTFKLTLSERNVVGIPLQYNFRSITSSDSTRIWKNISELKELVHDSDPDIREMAEMELSEAQELLNTLTDEIKILLIPKDPNDDKNVVMEIRGAAGGDEANIFAGDLYRMYIKYAESKGWKTEIMDSEACEAGGFSQISLMISGDSVYSYLKYESGSHRVQRVPATESQGRIHTSIATVLVMPEAEEVDVVINQSDLQIDTYRSQGAGGQNVNKTESAVRITHIPTGIVVACQVEKSQIQNREIAMNLLRARVLAAKVAEQEERIGAERKLKVGTGERSEKIRTYNYPQNRVTDHRIGFTIQKLDRVMEGDLDDIIQALNDEDQKQRMAEGNL